MSVGGSRAPINHNRRGRRGCHAAPLRRACLEGLRLGEAPPEIQVSVPGTFQHDIAVSFGPQHNRGQPGTQAWRMNIQCGPEESPCAQSMTKCSRRGTTALP
jgi:hypothetical protein